jgi:glycosyltransferase involved in cell wall biosynthesis
MLIVHPWIVHERGGERTFFEMARAFPRADLAVLFDRSRSLPGDIGPRIVRRSFVDGPLFDRVPYRALGPLLPLAAGRLDARGYDLILSSSSGWSHGVHAPGARHLCYMYSPARYLWSAEAPPGAGPAVAIAQLLRPALRRWDREAAARVESFAAISQLVRRRIWAHYGRHAKVIFPPVAVARMRAAADADRAFVLSVGELVPYKRFDLAIEVARRAGLPLVIVGDGPERRRLETLAAGADVRFTGRVTDATLVDLMARARVFLYPALEDFGIVTVEALASGTPVVGQRRGGTGSIVQKGMGELVEDTDPGLFAAALRRAWSSTYDRALLRERAATFGPERFARELRAWVDACLSSAEGAARTNRGRVRHGGDRLARYA